MKITNHNNKRFQKIAERVLNGTASDEEKRFLDEYYNLFDSERNSDLPQQDNEELYQQVSQRLQFSTNVAVKRNTFSFYAGRIAAAFALLMLTAVAVYKYNESHHPVAKIAQAKVRSKPITHGTNKAILTLGNGETITLDDKSAGKLTKLSGIQIWKTAKGELIYSSVPVSSGQIAENQFNTLKTPRGGIYQIGLPDGTRVWLNSSSSLKYPVMFTGAERKVELQGEAYFEVAHNADKPFLVVSQNQTVQVLGTHFNINAYPDEDYSKTTLLEGSVRVTLPTQVKPVMLVPGQQSIAKPSGIKVRKVDVDNTVSWKNGLFQFDNEEIHSIMKKVGRWYDVDVEYQNDIEHMRFGGTVSRYADITQVLHKLELTNTIHFKIEGRRILVMK